MEPCSGRPRPAIVAGAAFLLALLGARAPCYGVDASCSHPATLQEVGRGLYTIFLEAARVEHPIPAPPLMPLVHAADRVFCDLDATRRRGRMRYAVTKLAAAVTILKRKEAPPAQLAPFGQALQRLGFPLPLFSDLLTSPATSLADLEDATARLLDAGSPRSEAKSLKRECCPCIDHCDVGSSDGIATVEFEIDVYRDPRELFGIVDPRSWKTLLGMYFTASDEVTDSPTCKDGKPVCFHSDGPCREGEEEPPETDENRQPGTPWCGLLFEAFQAEWGHPSDRARFDNVLGIRTRFEPADAQQDTATGFRMDFRLCEAVRHTSGGVSGDCGVEVDCGYARVAEDGVGGTFIFGTKRISFLNKLNPDANAWAPIALEVLVKETALSACAGVPPSDEACTCYRDRCVQHREYEPSWEVEFCDD